MAGLAASGLVATACTGEVFTNSSGAGGSGASGGANTSASSGSGGGSSSSSGAGGEQPCGQHLPRVIACMQAPIFPWGPEDATFSGLVTGIGEPAPGCFDNPGPDGSSIRVPEWGNDDAAEQAVWFTFFSEGLSYNVGLATPGLTQDMFKPDTMVTVHVRRELDPFGIARSAIEVRVEGMLMVSVAANTSESIEVSEGPELCYEEDQICAYEDRAMVVAYEGEQATLGKGETQQVGDLLVTNDHFSHLYDLGACNFAEPVDFAVGAAALSPP